MDPLSYLEFSYLLKNAAAVVTDSGGVTEEATVYGVPCITLRDSTERPETVTLGTNMLVGDSMPQFMQALSDISSGIWKEGKIPELWDGKASDRIVTVLERLLSAHKF